MKLIDAIKRVDRSPQNTSWADIDDFAHIFDINVYDSGDFGERVKHHWIAPWFCSDDVVGISVYYMDDEPVAMQSRKARKSDRVIEFISEAAANKVRDYIMEIKSRQINAVPLVKNLHQDLGESYSVAYGNQLLTKQATYHGQPVTVTTTWRGFDAIAKQTRAIITYENGETEEVDVDELKLAFRVLPEVPQEKHEYEYNPRHENGSLLGWTPLRHAETDEEAANYCRDHGWEWRRVQS